MFKVTEATLQLMKDNPVFNGFEQAELQSICENASLIELKKDDYLFLEGSDSHEFYFLIEGEASVIKQDTILGKLKEIEIAVLHAGDTIGEMGLLDSLPRSASIKAKSALKLIGFSIPSLEKQSNINLPVFTRLKLNLAKKLSQYIRAGNSSTLEQKKKHASEIVHIINYDVTTGLPNQNMLISHLKSILSESDSENFALMQIEVSEFKEITNAMGIEFANEFLIAVAERLSKVLPEGTFLSRAGANQFIALLNYGADPNAIPSLCKRLLNAMHSAFIVSEEEIYVKGYIGVIRYPEDSKTAESLIKNVGIALDSAKMNDEVDYAFFDPTLNAVIEERRELIRDFRLAVEEDQFEIYYQPQINLATSELAGAECLIRWPHPHKGMISPALFIPIIEQSGMITELGDWIIKMACAQASMWSRACKEHHFTLAVNISAIQFKQKSLVDFLHGIVNELMLDPSRIELEITESAMLKDIDETVKKMKQLADIGFIIAIDDFGTGYSSLSYLRKMPINKLKIDQSFVKALAENREAKDIVKCIVALGKSLNLKIIAEGVEDVGQAEFLKSIGCDEGQGYLFSQALPAARFESEFLLKNGKAT